MSNQFEVGDVVKTDISNYEMIIELVDNTLKEMHCFWFNKSGKKQTGKFNPDTLILIKKKSK